MRRKELGNDDLQVARVKNEGTQQVQRQIDTVVI